MREELQKAKMTQREDVMEERERAEEKMRETKKKLMETVEEERKEAKKEMDALRRSVFEGDGVGARGFCEDDEERGRGGVVAKSEVRRERVRRRTRGGG